MVNQYFSTKFLDELDGIELLTAIPFFLKNANEEQILNFNQLVTVDQLESALQSIGYRVEAFETICTNMVQLFNEKLHSNMAADYVGLINEDNLMKQNVKQQEKWKVDPPSTETFSVHGIVPLKSRRGLKKKEIEIRGCDVIL